MEEILPQATDEKPKRDLVKKFRLTPAEVKQIEAKAARAGLTFSEYCRRAALDKPLVEKVPQELRRTIALAGSNLNQLTRLANAGKLNSVSAARLTEVVDRLLETLK